MTTTRSSGGGRRRGDGGQGPGVSIKSIHTAYNTSTAVSIGNNANMIVCVGVVGSGVRSGGGSSGDGGVLG